MATRLRVALDVTPATTGATGVARYTVQLAAALCEFDVELLPFALGRGTHRGVTGARRHRLPLQAYHRLWRVIGRPTAERLVGRDFDVLHALDMVAPPTRSPLVVTLHDLAALEVPQLHQPRQRSVAERQLEQAHGAARVIAVSAATAAAATRLGVDRGRITVVPLGVAAEVIRPYPPDGDAATEPPYFLVVGEAHPRKNLPTVVAAFLAADLPADVALVFAGVAAADVPDLAGRLGGRGRFLGPVSDAKLAQLYAGALALVFASHAEGFGLPVAEAMANGLPVLASEIPVLREVSGGHALFAAATDGQAWRRNIERIAAEPPLRRELAQAGREWIRPFTWRRTAELTLGCYTEAVACGS